MAEHHFVVKYDDNLNHWSVDVESEEVRFPDGTIWDEKESTWTYSYQGSEKFFTLPDGSTSDDLDQKFGEFISRLNN
jgi:hypothetical protein